uniref:Mitogen-activated protein kinase n=2 Tax=Hemiselmis andersenii TaxID=464988 RepID=A0A6U2DNT4_HEMAN|mmetsp:Transcript_25323/g.58674  ORF Transcript_25323/g.58674 Transcript_25323/m.58674 type:complete len:361 (+) Transcript_25323:123-1205(+)
MGFTIEGQVFDLPSRYVPLQNKLLGKGAYGHVCAVKNSENNERLAVKKVKNAFDDVIDAKRVLREIRLLCCFNHENVLSIKDLIMPPDASGVCEDVYIITELLDTDLSKVIYSPQPLIDDHCQYFLYQILRGLKYLHSARVLHRDLKPGNLLVNSNCDLKICDFGLARLDEDTNPSTMTAYVVTRWYRAPELLYLKNYSEAIDIWSVGCIFAEILGRKAFLQGKNYQDQLTVIFAHVGAPSDEDLQVVPNQEVRDYMKKLPKPSRLVPLAERFPKARPEAVDLLQKMLRFNPHKRLTAAECLSHPYLSEYHDPDDEPTADSTFEWEFENTELTRDQIRNYMQAEANKVAAHLQAQRAAAG